MEEGALCFPLLQNRSCRVPLTDPDQIRSSALVLGSLSVLITALNLLVILSIALFRQLQTTTNRILLSLAISDFLVGLVVIPVSVRTWRVCWLWGDVLCSLYYILVASLVMASVASVVLISVDRYIAVVDPMHYQTRMSTRTVNSCICAVWVYALLFSFITMNSIFNPERSVRCVGECTVTVLFEADLILALLIPFVIIIALYVRVFAVVVSQVQAARSVVVAPDQARLKQKSEVKAGRNLGGVVVAHLVCYTPYYCVLYSGSHLLVTQGEVGLMICGLLIYLNSAVNPLIYVLIYPRFRRAFRVIITLRVLRSGAGIL